MIDVDVVQTRALFAHALQILAHIHHGGGHRLGAAHDDVGLIFLQLPDICLFIQSAGNLDFHIVVVENLGRDVAEMVCVIGLEFHDLRSSINPFLSATVPRAAYHFFYRAIIISYFFSFCKYSCKKILIFHNFRHFCPVSQSVFVILQSKILSIS